MVTARPQAFSLGVHVVIAALLFTISQSIRTSPQAALPVRATHLIFPHLSKRAEPRSGGSNRSQLPAKHGNPPPTARRTFIPPATSSHPRLVLPITVAFEIPIPPTASSSIGDPYSRLVNGALGMSGNNGIGDRGCCEGIGNSKNGRPGMSAVRGAGVTPPQLIYKVEPEFSEEARRAKYQGVVVLSIIVDANGMVRSIRVLQALGMGLDEKAIDSVSHWRFRPGVLNGKPVATEATVQVSFQLL